MPTYEYMCGNCGRFEEVQSIKAAPLDACPKCGGPVTRLISAGGGMIFKGSGFYETDYRKPEYRKQAKEEGGVGHKGQVKSPDTTATAKPESGNQSEKKPDIAAGGNGDAPKGESKA